MFGRRYACGAAACMAAGLMFAMTSYASFQSGTPEIKNYVSIVDTFDTYNLVLDGNGGSASGGSSVTRTVGNKAEYSLSDVFTRSGYDFYRWEGTDAAYAYGDKVSSLGAPGSTVTLKAQWLPLSSGMVQEPVWDLKKTEDKDGDGTEDRYQLSPGESFEKDPSIRSTAEFAAYVYMAVIIPGDTAPVATLDGIDSHWTKIHEEGRSGSLVRIYRYGTTLQPEGASGSNPYDPLRRADRTTDLFKGFTVTGAAGSGSHFTIGIKPELVKAEGTTQEVADSLAKEELLGGL